MLAALSLLGLGIFGPGIANGLVSGGPQLGAGAAVGTGARRRRRGCRRRSARRGSRAARWRVLAGKRRHGIAAHERCRLGRRTRRARRHRPIRWIARRLLGCKCAGSAEQRSFEVERPEQSRDGAAARSERRFTVTRRIRPGRRPPAGAPAWAQRMKRGQTVSHGASPPPMPSAPATAMAAALPSISPQEIADVQDDPPSATGERPNPRRPTRGPRRSGTSASARRACRRRTGGLSPSAISVLAGGLAAALVWQSARGTIVPWVVQVDKLGEAQAVAPAIADYRPTDPQIAWHLARFIEQVRAIPADPIIVRQNWLRAYDFSTDKGALALNDYARANDPFAKVGKTRSRSRSPASSAPRPTASASPGSSAATRTASLAATERWTAILTIVVQPPRDAERLRKNPLGIYVHAINWSKELG